MEVKVLKNAVKDPKVGVTFKDKNGRTNLIKYVYRDGKDKFGVETLIVDTSMYWTDSYMDYNYIMEIIDGEIKIQEAKADPYMYY